MMMKQRVRALDGRQFRRPKKSKFCENVYFNTSTFVYLKLISIWVSCIAFDLLVGCRLELAWPIVLFVRHFNEIMNAPNGPLRFYSTFSIFYLLLTLTSDLICYLFLPVSILLFFASIHVWLQFAYQTIDRGLSPTVLIFWGLFIFFEYFFRFKIISPPQWYTSRPFLMATSVFSKMTDEFLVNQMSTTRLTLYRLFASHALGFPLVTLSFRLKTFTSNWLYERCRHEVQKRNEIFDRILTEAIPGIYDGKKRHELNSRPQQLAIEGDPLDFELDPTGSDLMDEPRLCLSSIGPVPSIFDKLSTAPSSNSPSQSARAAGGDGIPFSRKTSKIKLPMSYKHQNGNSSSQLNGKSLKLSSSSKSSSRNGRLQMDEMNDEIMDEDYPRKKLSRNKSSSSSSSSSSLISIISFFITFIQRFFVNWLLSIYSLLRSIGDILINKKDSIAANRIINNNNNNTNILSNEKEQQDDMISTTSGESSQRGVDDESDGEEGITISSLDLPSTNIQNIKSSNGITAGKKKLGKPQLQTSPPQQNSKANGRGRTPTIDGEFEMPISTSSSSSAAKGNTIKKGKPSQQNDEKRDEEADRLRIDLRGAKLIENELREQISALYQVEKSCKNEVQQYKLRYDQLDVKFKNLSKQQEQNKAAISSMEKRMMDAQQRKDQLEKELALEKCIGAKPVEKVNDGKAVTDSILETFKAKIAKLENDLRKTRAEVKNKEDYALKLESKLKEVCNQKSQAQKSADDGSLSVTRLSQENGALKKALSEENRIKQDLFKALKTSKAQIDALKARLNVSSSDENEILGAVRSEAFNNGDMFRGSPITAPPSPPPPSTSGNLDHLISMTQTYCMPYPFSSQYNGIRSSPSDSIRDSPTQHPLDPPLHQSLTSIARTS